MYIFIANVIRNSNPPLTLRHDGYTLQLDPDSLNLPRYLEFPVVLSQFTIDHFELFFVSPVGFNGNCQKPSTHCVAKKILEFDNKNTCSLPLFPIVGCIPSIPTLTNERTNLIFLKKHYGNIVPLTKPVRGPISGPSGPVTLKTTLPGGPWGPGSPRGPGLPLGPILPGVPC